MRAWTLCLMIGIALLAGCSGGGGGSEVADTKLHSGTEGVGIRFLDDASQDTVIEGDQLGLTLELTNKGTFSLDPDLPGILVLSIERDFLEFGSWDAGTSSSAYDNALLFPLYGKSLATRQGEKRLVRALLRAKDVDFTRNKVESRVVANVCYPYLTQLEEELCIDPNPGALGVVEKGCEAKDLQLTGQGAPIAITKVEQRTLPGENPDDVRVQLTITAENKGKGQLLPFEDYLNACLGLPREGKTGVWVSYVAFSDYTYLIDEGGDIECTPQPMQETERGYVTRCTLQTGIPKSLQAFSTPLSIELGYGYRSTASKTVSILSASQEFR